MKVRIFLHIIVRVKLILLYATMRNNIYSEKSKIKKLTKMKKKKKKIDNDE
jgi:hypothetical protein